MNENLAKIKKICNLVVIFNSLLCLQDEDKVKICNNGKDLCFRDENKVKSWNNG